MDDRILLIPTPVAPDPTAVAKWRAYPALMERLRAFLPLDVVRWPTLKGEQHQPGALAAMDEALRRQVRAFHHVVDVSFLTEFFFWATGDRPVRSHVVAGFVPLQAISHETDPLLGTVLEAGRRILAGPTGRWAEPEELVPMSMQGAAEADIKEAIADVKRTLDSDFYQRIGEEETAMSAVSVTSSRVPTLYLPWALELPGDELFFEILRRYAPNAEEGDKLHDWPIHLHKHAAGHELADKVIAFIKEMMAQREKAES